MAVNRDPTLHEYTGGKPTTDTSAYVMIHSGGTHVSDKTLAQVPWFGWWLLVATRHVCMTAGYWYLPSEHSTEQQGIRKATINMFVHAVTGDAREVHVHDTSHTT